MKFDLRLLACSAVALTLGGCMSSPIVGTWSGRGGGSDAPFTFGSVSFVGDNTFTAEARYGGETRVQSGTWATSKNELDLHSGQTSRHYTYKVDGTELVVTDPQSGKSITLDRMPK